MPSGPAQGKPAGIGGRRFVGTALDAPARAPARRSLFQAERTSCPRVQDVRVRANGHIPRSVDGPNRSQ